MGPFAASPGSLKGAVVLSVTCGLSRLSPFRSVLDNPISEGSFEADIASCLFGLNPLMPQYLLAFRLEFSIERRILQ
jgi:hypothetical protein